MVGQGTGLGTHILDDETIKLEVEKGMVKGSYDTPVRFGRPSKPSTFNEKGYSDHLPISMVLGEK